MSLGLGNICYTDPAGAVPPFVNVEGARNGASLDSSSYVVLGEEIGAAGTPAILLDDREIPMGGFSLDLYGGSVVVSSNAAPTVGDGLLQVIRNNIGSGRDTSSLVLAAGTPSTVTQNQNSPGLYFEASTWDGTDSILNAWLMQAVPDGLNIYTYQGSSPADLILSLNSFGQIVTTGGFFASGFEGGSYGFNDAGVVYELAIGPGSLPAGTMYLFPTTTATDPTAIAIANFDDTINREYFILGYTETSDWLTLTVGKQGTGTIRPVGFIPNIKFGDASVAPTAQIHVTASSGAAGDGPLKLTAGTLLGTPEPGLFEYDGTFLYFTTSTGVRQKVTLI